MTRGVWPWIALILALLALRLPSLGQPAGGDQGLYGYTGQRILVGDVPYRDVWDQKPPAIGVVYALLWRVWPAESSVPAADLAAAAAVAALLVVLGYRRFSPAVGFGAAALFLLLGDPYLQRLSGIYVRGQCEPFMALAVTAGLVLLASPARTRGHLVGAGLALGMAFWLKYNAGAYALTMVIAAGVWGPGSLRDWRPAMREVAWVAAGFSGLAAAVLLFFALGGALLDLRLATVDYNLRYSSETYEAAANPLFYLLTFPIQRARVDFLWFLGGIGALLLAGRARTSASALVILGWLAGAVLSIAINGSRGLPNYFVQANPALALAASAGLATLAGRRRLRYATAVLVLAGLWKVGADEPVWGWRLASLPGLVENVRFDLRMTRGQIDRDTYLRRFRGEKHDALEVERLVRHVRATTAPGSHIFVFGFSGGSVSWKSERPSASRFFWSRPITIGFASDRADFGWDGLLTDLRERPPALVALQKEEWRSREHFMSHAPARNWLETHYAFDHETPEFVVWRPKANAAEAILIR